MTTTSPSLRVVGAADVRRLLPISRCIDLMGTAMQGASNGDIAIPQRLITPIIDNSAYFALMPGSTLKPRIYGAKMVSVHPNNPAEGRPAHQGFVALFDHDTGAPVAIIDGAMITAIRTAAVSGLATRTLARTEARTHGVFGAGVQAAHHVEAIAAVRPIERVLLWARAQKQADELATQLRARVNCKVDVATDPEQAAACDIVSTVTSASEPVLRGEWIKAGTHINAVGAHSPKTREIDDAVVQRSRIYVDLLRSAMSEAGDLLIPINAGLVTNDHIVGELGQVIAGKIPGRENDEQITLYKSLGIFAQDLIAAVHVYRAACEENVGSLVPL
jgi:ornithine cyclodeaminase/alanine dehydrogenase-like protein (mu-crystallin family)